MNIRVGSRFVVALLLPLSLALAIGCGEEAKPASRGGESPPPREMATGVGPGVDAGSARLAPGEIEDVEGSLVDEAGEAIVGRSVIVVDAQGKRIELMSDEGGVFHAMGVVPPYDVGIARAPSGPRRVPTVYLGVSRENPSFELVEHDGPPAQAPSQQLRVSVSAAPCTTGRCWASFVSTSPWGGGAFACSFSASEPLTTVTLDHAFRTASVPSSEQIDVHVLTGDDSHAELSYGRASGVLAQAGASSDVALAAAPVATTSPLSIAASGSAIPEGWAWTVATWLELPDGGSMMLRYVDGPALVTRLPVLAGATFRAGAWARRPAGLDVLSHSSFAWSAPLDLRPSSVQLDLPAGVELVRPRAGAAVSRRGGSVAWTSASPALVTATLGDVARDARVFHVYTTGAGLSLRALARLGVTLPEPGEHVLDLVTRPGATLDEVTGKRTSATYPGAVTHQRVKVLVTP